VHPATKTTELPVLTVAFLYREHAINFLTSLRAELGFGVP